MNDSLELIKLKKLIDNGRNVLLFSRGSPESQLVVTNYFRTLHRSGKKIATVEISNSWDSLEFSNHLSLAILEAFKSRSVYKQGGLSYQAIMEDALCWADSQCLENECHMVIVLNEVHLLKDMPGGRVDAAFRTVIQRIRNISFVFMSSDKEALSRMFIKKSEPLYGMASSVRF